MHSLNSQKLGTASGDNIFAWLIFHYGTSVIAKFLSSAKKGLYTRCTYTTDGDLFSAAGDGRQ